MKILNLILTGVVSDVTSPDNEPGIHGTLDTDQLFLWLFIIFFIIFIIGVFYVIYLTNKISNLEDKLEALNKETNKQE